MLTKTNYGNQMKKLHNFLKQTICLNAVCLMAPVIPRRFASKDASSQGQGENVCDHVHSPVVNCGGAGRPHSLPDAAKHSGPSPNKRHRKYKSNPNLQSRGEAKRDQQVATQKQMKQVSADMPSPHWALAKSRGNDQSKIINKAPKLKRRRGGRLSHLIAEAAV